MKIVLVGEKNLDKFKTMAGKLSDLGQEVTIIRGNPFYFLFKIPFFVREGDIYIYSGGRVLGLIMRIVQKLLNKPVVPLESMPKEVYSFERKCYKEYEKYFHKGKKEDEGEKGKRERRGYWGY